jgi:hypothetical protein
MKTNQHTTYRVYKYASIDLSFIVANNCLDDLIFKLNVQIDKGKNVDMDKEILNYNLTNP